MINHSTGASNGSVKVTNVNLSTKTLTLQALDADVGVVAGNYLVFKGSLNVTFDGLDNIISRQTGDLFGIDRSNYDLWKGNHIDAAGADLSLDLILQTAGQAVGRGLTGDVKLYVNHRTYERLNVATDKDLRRLDSSYSKDKTARGVKRLCFVYQEGIIDVVSSIYVKETDAFMIPPATCRRIGATDVTYKPPGFEKDQIFHRMEKNAGFSVRCYTHQALFVEFPAHCAKISNLKAA